MSSSTRARTRGGRRRWCGRRLRGARVRSSRRTRAGARPPEGVVREVARAGLPPLRAVEHRVARRARQQEHPREARIAREAALVRHARLETITASRTSDQHVLEPDVVARLHAAGCRRAAVHPSDVAARDARGAHLRGGRRALVDSDDPPASSMKLMSESPRRQERKAPRARPPHRMERRARTRNVFSRRPGIRLRCTADAGVQMMRPARLS